MTTARRLVVVCDTHCGSSLGLLPPGLVLGDPARELRLNRAQAWIWEWWQVFFGKVIAAPFDLVLNGDQIEGMHHRTTQVVDPDPGVHVAIAEHALAPLAERAGAVWVVRGTEAHTGPSSEAGLSVKLGGVPDPFTRMPVWDVLELTYCGVPCMFFHHMPTSVRKWTESTGLGIMLAQAQLGAVRAGKVPPRVLGMAHRHTYGLYEDAAALAFANPSWQLKSRYGNKVAPASECQVGAVILDWTDRADGELPDVRRYVRRLGDEA